MLFIGNDMQDKPAFVPIRFENQGKGVSTLPLLPSYPFPLWGRGFAPYWERHARQVGVRFDTIRLFDEFGNQGKGVSTLPLLPSYPFPLWGRDLLFIGNDMQDKPAFVSIRFECSTSSGIRGKVSLPCLFFLLIPSPSGGGGLLFMGNDRQDKTVFVSIRFECSTSSGIRGKVSLPCLFFLLIPSPSGGGLGRGSPAPMIQPEHCKVKHYRTVARDL